MMIIRNSKDLENLCQTIVNGQSYSNGTEVTIEGSFSQTISKTYNEYQKLKAAKLKGAASLGIFGASLFTGPGALLGLGAAAAGAIHARGALNSFKAMPCADEVEFLKNQGFHIASNDGTTVRLVKDTNKQEYG